MSTVAQRVPLLVTAGSLLFGSMVLGAAATHRYSEDGTLYASACPTGLCEDTGEATPDDCGDSCRCNDSNGCVS